MSALRPHDVAVLVIACLVSCARHTNPPLDQIGDSQSLAAFPLRFVTPEGLSFAGQIDLPPAQLRNGWGVLMIGGGFGNDLDWTAPGSLEIDGRNVQFTISGEMHADAPLISRALIKRGFIVARWSTIREDDPLRDRWPIQATTYPLATMVEHARAALDAFRAQKLCEPDRIILLGHSLGAARAWTISHDDPAIQALILLAPAMLTREGTKPSNDPRKHGLQWGEDVLKQRAIPTLIICGELDKAQGVHGPAMARIARINQLAHVDVKIMPNLGHQLGPLGGHDGRFGPIDDAVLKVIADWASQRAGG